MNQKIYGINSYYPFTTCPDLIPLIGWIYPYTMMQMDLKAQTFCSSSTCGSQPGLPLFNSWPCSGAPALNIFVGLTGVLWTCWQTMVSELSRHVGSDSFLWLPQLDTLPELFHCNSNARSSVFPYVPRKADAEWSKQANVRKSKLLPILQGWFPDVLTSGHFSYIQHWPGTICSCIVSTNICWMLCMDEFILEMRTQREMRYDGFFSEWEYVNQWFPITRSVAKSQGNLVMNFLMEVPFEMAPECQVDIAGPCMSAYSVSLHFLLQR